MSVPPRGASCTTTHGQRVDGKAITASEAQPLKLHDDSFRASSTRMVHYLGHAYC
jgi:hypothetical protein